jgi:hypothetical protein
MSTTKLVKTKRVLAPERELPKPKKPGKPPEGPLGKRQFTPDLRYRLTLSTSIGEQSAFVIATQKESLATFPARLVEYWCLTQKFAESLYRPEAGAKLGIEARSWGSEDDLLKELAELDTFDRLLTSTEASWKPGAPTAGRLGFYARSADGIVGFEFGVTRARELAWRWVGNIIWYQSAGITPRKYVVGAGSLVFAYGRPLALQTGERWFTATMAPINDLLG